MNERGMFRYISSASTTSSSTPCSPYRKKVRIDGEKRRGHLNRHLRDGFWDVRAVCLEKLVFELPDQWRKLRVSLVRFSPQESQSNKEGEGRIVDSDHHIPKPASRSVAKERRQT
jgi:hypothetical protein